MLLTQVGHPSALRRRGIRLTQVGAVLFVFLFALCIWKRDWQIDYNGDEYNVRPYEDVPVEVPEGDHHEDEYWSGDYGVEPQQEGGEVVDIPAGEIHEENPDSAAAVVPVNEVPPNEVSPTGQEISEQTHAHEAPVSETSQPVADEAHETSSSEKTAQPNNGAVASHTPTPSVLIPPAALESEPSDSQKRLKGHLVVATTRKDDITWAETIGIPDLEVIRYVADDPTAQYRPPENKGHEAMMYFQYMYEFYDKLPDYSIFTHGEEFSWHVESLFRGSIKFAIEHVDLWEVIRRRYLNLRVSWRTACPDWIRTTNTVYNQFKTEERFMHMAFAENFVNDTVPEILATPCCSQFALSREAIQSVPREQYKFHMDWLLTTSLPDAISGRTWEHMFQWLFLRKAVDCPYERQTYCRSFHICFKDDETFKEYAKIEKSLETLKQRLGGVGRGSPAGIRESIMGKVQEGETRMKEMLDEALFLGADEKTRLEIAPDIYEETDGV